MEPLTDDYRAYTAGQVMLETADRLVAEEGEPALQQYLLLVRPSSVEFGDL